MLRLTAILSLTLAACGGTAEVEQPDIHPVDAHAGTEHVAEAPAPAEPEMADGVMFSNEAELTAGPVSSPVHVVMGVHGMTIQPAGEITEGSGHHHIIVDGSPIPAGTVVPSDATHIHFGGGQTEADVELTPGEHTLTLQLANGMHESYGPEWSKTLTVTVAPAAAQ